ncbi:hypothetical protein ACQ4WX_47565 [Streptomyces lasalocidi]
MAALIGPRVPGNRVGATTAAAPRLPFGTVDEVSRHWLRDAEPETVHIEVHLSGRLEPGLLRHAFAEALRRHPGVLRREAAGRWYRRRYAWEVTPDPDVDPVRFPPPGPDALALARKRALADCPPLSASPPLRLEVVEPGPDAAWERAGPDPAPHRSRRTDGAAAAGHDRRGVRRGDGRSRGRSGPSPPTAGEARSNAAVPARAARTHHAGHLRRRDGQAGS